MTEKELRMLKRAELLEIMVEQSKKIDELEAEIEYLKEKLNSRKILIEEAGSIAEASLRLNEVFEAVQKAADQYLDNVKYQARLREQKRMIKKERQLAGAPKRLSHKDL